MIDSKLDHAVATINQKPGKTPKKDVTTEKYWINGVNYDCGGY